MIHGLQVGPPLLKHSWPLPWMPVGIACSFLTKWQDLRTNRQAAADFEGQLRIGDVVLCLGDRVREALRLPRVLLHPFVRGGVTYRYLPALSSRLYGEPTWIAILDLLKKDLEHAKQD